MMTWNASTSVVAGYNIYWASTSGGPYTKVNTTIIAGTTFRDTTHASGFWIATAVDAAGDESVISNQGTIPNPPTAFKVAGNRMP